MNKDKYELLICINNCPDTYISKEIIFNVIRWNYSKIDSIIKQLKDENLINVYTFDNNERYTVSEEGNLYIKNYQDEIEYKTVQAKKEIFDKYIFPTISSVLFFLLGILASIIFK